MCASDRNILRATLRALLVAAGLHVVDLDRDVAAVVRIVGEVDDAGAAATDFVDDDVLADFLRHAGSRSCGALCDQITNDDSPCAVRAAGYGWGQERSVT